MIVVADASPFIVLIKINSIDHLPALFGKVFVPPKVLGELRDTRRPQAVREYFDCQPDWLLERSPVVVEDIPRLDAGEVAAICLAQELRAELLLIDEARGRDVATKRGIRIMGTVGVLELAAHRGLIRLAEAFERLKETDFWVPHDFLDGRLARHLYSSSDSADETAGD